MKQILGRIICILFVFQISNLKASHTLGGQITYKYVSGTTYKVRLTLYANCGGFVQPSFVSENVKYQRLDNNANCNVNPIIVALPFIDTNSAVDVCSNVLTTCQGGTIFGVREYIYETDINLGIGNRFEFWWGGDAISCCRTTAVNYSGIQNQAVHTTMFKGMFPTNNSPVIKNSRLPFICANTAPTCYQLNAVDIPDAVTNNTLLKYELVSTANEFNPPPTGCAASVFPWTSDAYNLGYTAAQPFGLASSILPSPVNDSTGLLTIPTIPAIGFYIVVIKVTEYDTTNGNLNELSIIYRDFAVTCGTGGTICTSTLPLTCDIGQTIFSGNGYVNLSPDRIKICQGDTLDFCVTFTDPTSAIFLESTNFTNPPYDLAFLNATINGNGTDSLTVCAKGIIPLNINSFDIFIEVRSGCPLPSRRFKKIRVEVQRKTRILPDVDMLTKCGQDGIQLIAIGNTNYLWYDISGGPAQAINCTNCDTVLVAPMINTTYVVESFPKTIGLNCYKDIITIKVAPDFILTASSNDDKVCFGTPVQLLADISLAPSGFTYLWTRLDDNGNPVLPLYLNSAIDKNPTTITTPIGSAIPPGLYNYQVEATSPDGCKRTDIITINITQEKPPIFTLSQSQKLFCNYNGAANINAAAIFAPPPAPASCAISNGEPCYGDPSPFLGTTNGISSANAATQPGLLAGAQKTMRQQYLFTMAELAAKGIPNKGKISALSFYITNLIPDLNKDYKSYSNVTIKVGCTNLNSLSGLALNSPFSAAPTTIVYNKPLRVKQGLNEIKFANPTNLIAYEYDGTGATPNFIIEITSTSANNAIVNGTPQVELMSSFYTSSVFNSGATLPTNIINSSSSKPNFKFRYCSNSPTDNTVNTFNWTSNLPSAVFSNSAIANPSINFTQSGTYTLNCEVTTASKACKEDKTIQVFVRPKPLFNFTALSSYLNICSNNNSFNILNYVFPKTNVEFSGSTAITNSLFGTFNPSLAANGNNTVIMTVQDSAQYAVAPNGPCLSTENITIHVDAFKPATITNKGILNSNYCIDDKNSYQLKIIPPQTGVFSGALNASGEFVPANLGVGTQQLYYTTPAPCGDKEMFEITVHKKPTITINLDESNLCIPVTVKLNALTDPNQGFYKWKYNSGQTSNTQNASAEYTSVLSDKIELQFTDNFGCTNIADKTITTLARPKAMFKPSTNNTTTFSPTISFENTSIDVAGSTSEYKWNIGNLMEAYGKNTVFNFENNPGNHSISLLVKSSNGCEDLYTDNVNITVNYALFVPTAFNPNSSSSNENRKLFIKSIGLQKDFIKFQVYDRLGAKVFESLDFNTFWNGKVNNNGSYCQPGVYVWKATIKDVTNKSYELNGNTVLLK